MTFAESVRAAEAGKTHLFSLGQAGFLIKSAGGQLLAIDPYLSDCVEKAEGGMGFKRLMPRLLSPEELTLTALICTHFHMDHYDPDAVPGLMKNGVTRLFAARDCRELALEQGLDMGRAAFVRPGDACACGDFDLRFIDCDHGEGAPLAVGAVIRVDGRVICEVGDTRLRLDRAGDIPKGTDVLIAPINGAYGNMNEADCVALALRAQPRLTVPCHYGMFALHGGSPGRFLTLAQDAGLPCLLMTMGERYTFPES